MTQDAATAEAIRRIENAASTGVDSLDLGDLLLTELPVELGSLTNLLELTLGNAVFDREEEQDLLPYLLVKDRSSLRRPLKALGGLSKLTHLKRLDLSGLDELESLTELAAMANLEVLCLPDCRRFGKLNELERLGSLTTLFAWHVDFQSVATILKLKTLEWLHVTVESAHENTEELPNLSALSQLRNLRVGGRLKRLPGLEVLTALASLDLGASRELEELPDLSALSQLQNLRAGGRLKRLPGLDMLTALTALDLSNSRELEELPDLSALSQLQYLAVGGHLKRLPGLDMLTALASLDLSAARELKELPDLSALSQLQNLRVGGCLKRLPGLDMLTNLTSLDLSACREIEELPDLFALSQLQYLGVGGHLKRLPGLETLGELESLDLSACRQLEQLPDFSRLTSLRRLRLDGANLANVQFLESLPSLEVLTLDACGDLGSFAPIRNHLRTLLTLSFFGSNFDDLPPELSGSGGGQNVIARVRAHFQALDQQGPGDDRECKVLLLGNGRVGKTSLVKMLLGEAHDPAESSTHGIQLWTWLQGIELDGDSKAEPVRLNIWDFGGQDVYHNTHRLFLSTKAVFVVVWDAFDTEGFLDAQEDPNGYLDHRRPLHYWLDQIHSLHPDPQVLIVRSKSDLDAGRAVPDWRPAVPEPYRSYPAITVSAITDRQQCAVSLKRQLYTAVTSELGGRARRMMGAGRLRVKESVRAMQATNDIEIRALRRPSRPYLHYDQFWELVREHCGETADAADPRPLLRWLHDTGVVYHRFSDFGGMIIVEQRWAIDGIYSLFDRATCHARLLQSHGRFRPSQVHAWAWADKGYTDEEQSLFLSFMRSCRIAFTLLHKQESAYNEPIFVVPYYLPPRELMQENIDQLLGRFGRAPLATSWAEHQYLHQGLMGGFLAKLVQLYGRSATLWRDGAAFLADGGRTAAVIEWKPAALSQFGGRIVIQVFGDGHAARDLLWAVQATFVFQPAFPEGLRFQLEVHIDEDWEPTESSEEEFDKLAPSTRTTAVGKRIAISRATEDPENPGIGTLPTLLYEELAPRAEEIGVRLLFDEGEHDHSGIVPLMEELANSDFVYVFLSRKYLFSKWCMFELMRLYQTAPAEQFEKERIKMLRYPSAELTAEEIEGKWGPESVELARRLRNATDERLNHIYKVDQLGVSREPCYDWFKFIADDDHRWKFLNSLSSTIYEELAAPGEPPQTVEEINRLRHLARGWADRAFAAIERPRVGRKREHD
jgi:internalin A